MLIATDLDGTFLAGDTDARQQLYQLISNDTDITLVFVTGRGLEAVLPILSDAAIPVPHYVIADVGATVVDGRTRQAVQPLLADIDTLWPGERAVSEALQGIPGLQRQEVPQQRRCSYFCDSEAVTDELHRIANEQNCDLLYSADRYLDFLPRGVNKGSTLRRLVHELGIDMNQVLVAGDTLNDLSMFEQGFRGVCVGESEPALLAATVGRTRVLHSHRVGCAGILEALDFFRFVDRTVLLPPGSDTAARCGKAERVIVYHRLPYEEAIGDDGTLHRRPHSSPNGIIPTLLGLFADGRKGSWIAWSCAHAGEARFETHTTVDRERYPGLRCARVELSSQDVDIFYKRFSKEAFWPTLHTFWERAQFREDDWQVFLKVNRLFAERSAAESAHGATVWLHDYNLWMVPAALRELRPDLKIAFFHHTYFPSADVFNVMPWRRDIVGSLLQCDYIGFHIPRQAENFVDVARGVAPLRVLETKNCAPRFLTYGCAVGLDEMTTAIEVHGRRIGIGAHPVGLDVGRIGRILADARTARLMDRLRREMTGQRVILSVELLDYTKGTLEKLLAFEQLLEQNDELRQKVTLIAVCVPAASEMTIYDTLQTQIEQAVGRINGRFSRVGWTPVQFFFRPIPVAELVAYYAIADVMWITPLRDGLNLVSKEYVATQGLMQGGGVLVLSEFAGAAAELHGAVLTNPHDRNDLRDKCLYALNIHRAEAESRLRELFAIVQYNDIVRWGAEFLAAVESVSEPPVQTVMAA